MAHGSRNPRIGFYVGHYDRVVVSADETPAREEQGNVYKAIVITYDDGSKAVLSARSLDDGKLYPWIRDEEGYPIDIMNCESSPKPNYDYRTDYEPILSLPRIEANLRWDTCAVDGTAVDGTISLYDDDVVIGTFTTNDSPPGLLYLEIGLHV